MVGQRQQSSVDQCELSVLKEQQDFHARPIVDVGSLYRLRLVRSLSARYEETKFVLDSLTDWKPVQLMMQIVCNVIQLPLSQNQPAAEQSTDCSLFISSSDNPANKLLQ